MTSLPLSILLCIAIVNAGVVDLNCNSEGNLCSIGQEKEPAKLTEDSTSITSLQLPSQEALAASFSDFTKENCTIDKCEPKLDGKTRKGRLLQAEQLFPNADQNELNEIKKIGILPSIFLPPRPISCGASLRRTYDGSCNNVRQVTWGKRATPFRRLLSPDYDNGRDSPRTKASNGSPLKSAREISRNVHPATSSLSASASMFLMQWGQFLDHDISFTPVQLGFGGYGGAEFDCSDCNAGSPCFPIPAPRGDPFFTGCIPLTRSLPASTQGSEIRRRTHSRRTHSRRKQGKGKGKGKGGVREQLNDISAYIDASNVYGTDTRSANSLRTFSGGKLKTSGANLLPRQPNPDDLCRERETNGQYCFKAGDHRVNVQPGLIAMHEMWVKEHNRLADEFGSIMGSSDEDIFQKTRKMIGAIHQRITYTEWLPMILGPDLMLKYGLSDSSRYVYDTSCDASILNEFATAAFRFGHSLVHSIIQTTSGSINLGGNFNNPQFFHADPQVGGKILAGNARYRCQHSDRFVIPELTNRLFQTPTTPALDLIALNIQRGRDHGLPSYMKYRRHFGLPTTTNFAQLDMDSGAIAALRTVYGSVDDIDLFPGILAENHVPGGMIGPTGGRIMAEQFRRLKKCDRFFYKNTAMYSDLDPILMDYIQAQTMFKVVCRHTTTPMLPRNPFSSSSLPQFC